MTTAYFAFIVGCASPIPFDKGFDSGEGAVGGYLRIGDLQITPGSIDFGVLPPGQEHAEELLLENLGEKELDIASLYIDGASEFTLATSAMSFAIDPGSEEAITVLFNPLIEQEYSGQLNVLVSAESGIGQLPITGVCDLDAQDTGMDQEAETDEPSVGVFEVDLTEFDFGDIAKNTTATVTANLTNGTDQDIYISDITSSVPVFGISEYSDLGPNATISSGMTRSLLLTFTPTEEQNYSGVITVHGDLAPVTIDLSGAGKCTICAPDINIYTGGSGQDLLNQFAVTLFNNPDSQQLSISNTGDEPLEIYSIEIHNDVQVPSLYCGSDAQYSHGFSSATIEPNQSHSIDIDLYYSGSWGDGEALFFCGADEAQNSLVIHSNDPDEGALTIRLGGTVSYF
jgi:hypothetical protein